MCGKLGDKLAVVPEGDLAGLSDIWSAVSRMPWFFSGASLVQVVRLGHFRMIALLFPEQHQVAWHTSDHQASLEAFC